MAALLGAPAFASPQLPARPKQCTVQQTGEHGVMLFNLTYSSAPVSPMFPGTSRRNCGGKWLQSSVYESPKEHCGGRAMRTPQIQTRIHLFSIDSPSDHNCL